MTVPPPTLERLLAEEPFVRALARSLVGNDPGAADDVVQQTWRHAMQHEGSHGSIGERDPPHGRDTALLAGAHRAPTWS